MPAYPSNAISKSYWISDAMDEALTFNDDITVEGVKADGSTVDLTGTDAYVKILNTKDMGDHDVTFLLKFDYDKIRAYSKIHVSYSAIVNEKAVVGTAIVNHAELQYNNNPYNGNDYTTIPDDTKVYVFGIKVNKIAAGTKTPLSGAEFKLQRNGETSKFVEVSTGVYRKALNTETGSETLVTAANGKLTVYGLKGADDDGNQLTYQLVETKAPGGYNKLGAPIDVTLTPIQDEAKDYTGHLEGESEIGYVAKDVENKTGKLPKTGGIGTIVFSVLGVLMIAGGVMLAASRKKA